MARFIRDAAAVSMPQLRLVRRAVLRHAGTSPDWGTQTMTYLMLAGGLALLLAGGEVFLRGALGLALRTRLPRALVGLVVLGFGTSAPELAVSVDAALRDAPGIVLGNVVGSNIANILLILGVTALISPIASAGLLAGRDLAALIAGVLVLLPAFAPGLMGPAYGAGLLAGLAVYLVASFRARAAPLPEPTQAPRGWAVTLAGLGGGLAGLVLGAQLLVGAAVALARDFGASDALIGLTIVAVGTSLPELVTSVLAALKRQAGFALGNIAGSNIFNVFGILGVSALIAPLPVDPRFLTLDLPLLAAATAALALLAWRGARLGRAAGACALAGYAGWVLAGAL